MIVEVNVMSQQHMPETWRPEGCMWRERRMIKRDNASWGVMCWWACWIELVYDGKIR